MASFFVLDGMNRHFSHLTRFHLVTGSRPRHLIASNHTLSGSFILNYQRT